MEEPDRESLHGPHELPVRGTEVNYYVVCPRKCWLFMRGMEQERTSEWVLLGRLTDEASFRRERQRGVEIGGAARLDFTDGAVVHEVKHGPAQRRAHVLQVAYYLRLLRERGIETHAVLHYPRQRRKETIQLTPALEAELAAVLHEITRLRSLPTPPQVAKRLSICRACAYEDLCWSDGDGPEPRAESTAGAEEGAPQDGETR